VNELLIARGEATPAADKRAVGESAANMERRPTPPAKVKIRPVRIGRSADLKTGTKRPT